MSSLREALKGSEMSAITAGATALAETLNRVSTAAYQASAAEAGSNGSDGAGDGTSGLERRNHTITAMVLISATNNRVSRDFMSGGSIDHSKS